MLWRKRAGLFLLYDLSLEIYTTNPTWPSVYLSDLADLHSIMTLDCASNLLFCHPYISFYNMFEVKITTCSSSLVSEDE